MTNLATSDADFEEIGVSWGILLVDLSGELPEDLAH